MHFFNAILRAVLTAAVVLGCVATAVRADTVKVGVIAPFSGTAALTGRNIKAGIDAWFALHGKTAGAAEIEIVTRDLPAPDVAKAKSLAQDLMRKAKVHYVLSAGLAPDVTALVSPMEAEDVPLLLLDEVSLTAPTKHPMIMRLSQVLEPEAALLAHEAIARGIKKVMTIVSLEPSGLQAEAAFKKAYAAVDGTVVEAGRILLTTTEFDPVMSRIKDSDADAVFVHLPQRAMALKFAAAFIPKGVRDKGVKILATDDFTREANLADLGDATLGVISATPYVVTRDAPQNSAFVVAANATLATPAELETAAVAAFDAMQLVTRMIEATHGKKNVDTAIAAVKGFSWDSPRGAVTLDASRHILTGPAYLRIVERTGDKLINRIIDPTPLPPPPPPAPAATPNPPSPPQTSPPAIAPPTKP